MTNDIAALVAELTALLEKATPGPWAYRPHNYDDWDFIRGGETEWEIGTVRPIVAVSKNAEPDCDFDEHRRNRTDPYEPNGRLIVAAVNGLRPLLTALQSLQAERDEIERILKLRDQQLTDEIALSSRFASLWDTAQETIRRQREALEGVVQYASDTLSGRADGPQDVAWHRDGWREVRTRARAALEPAGGER